MSKTSVIHACYHEDCDEDDQELHECDKWEICAECEDIERGHTGDTVENHGDEAEHKNLKDGDYVLTDGAAWFTVGNISVRISSNAEGVTCDMYPLHHETEDSIASTYAFFDEADQSQEGN